ncbi:MULTISPECIES: DUF3015 family protein [Aliarcobacter]|jgi:hypothetical protein|uniref:DUF3015 domain-containing protein n=2 Tax=Aliarcobacter skirrowii TaxID=28200 RepID=A0AAD0WMU5_9BACT|nr:DUF3015 family protein [Aliarcobacter skirrowii]AXX84208.1 DUF3015 domain-containing protein [Aliarcobacter skirrowii CCUG 10374]KAB0621607.1 DUF3015 domain-containing protein [Aliarcobacter skirrowii CCUG 10374]MCT7445798.1 DUF3015 domain-containing protein [Aliarcobacter skirrowii]MDX4012341.1 DUF3015 family protein [Aliarcobacter skirrowii]MDX4026070.1 DUF3015 family protein [Aliarcobacter skirrowii]
MKKVVLAAASVLMASSLYANNTNTGCGLGTIVIKDQSTTIMQVLAATTNGTSGNQTFGITSGTLNCKQPASFVSNDKLHRFINENMDELAMDISVGNGETLNTVATLMNIEDRATFASKLQANFTTIYSGENVSSAEVIDNIAKLI